MTKRSLAGRLNEAGVPVARIFASTNTLHPLVLTRALIWDRATGPATHLEFQHADIDHPTMQTNPFADMFRQRVEERRLDLRQPPSVGEPPVFAELRELGMTDWLGNTFPFGELGPSISGPRASGGGGHPLLLLVPAPRRRAETCAAALAAASEALDLMDLLAAKRREVGQPTPGLDIALHVGIVQYGNVGTDSRLDFTVIGPAVNEAARIEALCGPLGRPLLVSQAFAAAAAGSQQHLMSLRRHPLRGVREETEIFTLAAST